MINKWSPPPIDTSNTKGIFNALPASEDSIHPSFKAAKIINSTLRKKKTDLPSESFLPKQLLPNGKSRRKVRIFFSVYLFTCLSIQTLEVTVLPPSRWRVSKLELWTHYSLQGTYRAQLFSTITNVPVSACQSSVCVLPFLINKEYWLIRRETAVLKYNFFTSN